MNEHECMYAEQAIQERGTRDFIYSCPKINVTRNRDDSNVSPTKQ